jgi:hypothetical protein
MSIFYLLPPRSTLADYLADCLNTVLPGLDLDAAARERLWRTLSEAAAGSDVFLVHREDLPVGERSDRALQDGCGARAGDEVVEVRTRGRGDRFTSTRWQMSAESPADAA